MRVSDVFACILRSGWPPATIDWLLRAAFLEDAAAARAWRTFEAEADFDHLTAGETRLIGLVARRLALIAPDSPMLARMGGIARANWSRSQLVTSEAASGLRALAAASIPMLVIKDASRIAAGDPLARGRMVHEIDIVVVPETLSQAFDILVQDGWRPAGPGTPLYHRAHLADAAVVNLVRGRFGRLNLYRTPFEASFLSPMDESAVWERAVEGKLGGTNVRLPSAADAVAIAIAGGIAYANASSDWLFDIGACFDAGLDWKLFAATAHRRGLQAPAAVVLQYIRERLDRAAPAVILDDLRRAAVRRPFVLLATLAEMRLGSRGIGLFPAGRAVAEQMRLRSWRRRWRLARRWRIFASRVSGMNAVPPAEPALQHDIGLHGRRPGEPWSGTVDLALLVALPAATRRVDFEVNSINRHHLRLSAFVRQANAGERLLRFRFSVSLAAEEPSLLVAASPLQTFNADAPPDLAARYAATPFRIAALRTEALSVRQSKHNR